LSFGVTARYHGWLPTLMGLPRSFVAVEIGVTLPEPLLANVGGLPVRHDGDEDRALADLDRLAGPVGGAVGVPAAL
jgi:hypothetical protein